MSSRPLDTYWSSNRECLSGCRLLAASQIRWQRHHLSCSLRTDDGRARSRARAFIELEIVLLLAPALGNVATASSTVPRGHLRVVHGVRGNAVSEAGRRPIEWLPVLSKHTGRAGRDEEVRTLSGALASPCDRFHLLLMLSCAREPLICRTPGSADTHSLQCGLQFSAIMDLRMLPSLLMAPRGLRHVAPDRQRWRAYSVSSSAGDQGCGRVLCGRIPRRRTARLVQGLRGGSAQQALQETQSRQRQWPSQAAVRTRTDVPHRIRRHNSPLLYSSSGGLCVSQSQSRLSAAAQLLTRSPA